MKKRRQPIEILKDPENILKNIPDPPKLAPILNRIIDETIHPIAEKNKALYILDSILHTTAEIADTIMYSITKTLRYNIPKLIKKK